MHCGHPPLASLDRSVPAGWFSHRGCSSHQGKGQPRVLAPPGQAGFCRSDPKPTRKTHPPSGVSAPNSRHCCPPKHGEQKMGKSHEARALHSSRPLPGNDRALHPPPACVHAPLREHLLLRRPSVRAWRPGRSGKAGPAPPGPSNPQQIPARKFAQPPSSQRQAQAPKEPQNGPQPPPPPPGQLAPRGGSPRYCPSSPQEDESCNLLLLLLLSSQSLPADAPTRRRLGQLAPQDAS